MPPGKDPTSRRFTARPVAPFDFDLSAGIFTDGDPSYRSYDGEEFWEVMRLAGRPVLFTIVSNGTVAKPSLRVELRTADAITDRDAREARALVDSHFNLSMDLKPFYRAVRNDPVMSFIASELYGLKSPTTATVFEALIDSIIEQQISLAAAHSMQGRLIRAFGDRLELDGRKFHAFPTPEKLASVRLDRIRACGLSGKKSEYVKDISVLVAGGRLDLERYETYDDIDEIREELKAIRGIGAWTAEMTMIRGLHKMDSIPADDVGLQAKISHFYGRGAGAKASSDDVRRVAESWGKWRGLGGYYLIVAHRLGLEPAGRRAETPEKVRRGPHGK